MKKNQDLDRRLEGYSRSAGALRAIRRSASNRGVRYSAAAAAGAALVGAGSAEAALINSPNTGFSLTAISTSRNLGLDVDGDGNNDLFVFAGGYLNITSFGSTSTSFSYPGYAYLYNFAGVYGNVVGLRGASFNVSAAGITNTFVSTGRSTNRTFPAYTPPGTTFTSTFTRIAAFSFTAGTNTSGTPNLGWLRALIQFGAGSTRISFPNLVYNTTPGGSIHAGDVPSAVPEPSSLALMGLGLLALGGRGVREMRRRKKKPEPSA